jgi:hypothetical protein
MGDARQICPANDLVQFFAQFWKIQMAMAIYQHEFGLLKRLLD